MSVLQAHILRIPDGTIQLEGENFIQNGKLIKETTMNHDIMMIPGIIEMIFMNKIFGNTVTDKGNEKENVKDLNLTGTETTRGDQLNAVRVQCTCDALRALEHLPHSPRVLPSKRSFMRVMTILVPLKKAFSLLIRRR